MESHVLVINMYLFKICKVISHTFNIRSLKKSGQSTQRISLHFLEFARELTVLFTLTEVGLCNSHTKNPAHRSYSVVDVTNDFSHYSVATTHPGIADDKRL